MLHTNSLGTSLFTSGEWQSTDYLYMYFFPFCHLPLNVKKKKSLLHFIFSSESVNCLLKAIEIYTDMGKFVMAAKHHQSIAEIYETEVSLNITYE